MPPSLPTDEPEAEQLTGESSPPKRGLSPTVANGALVVQCQKKPAKKNCKALRLVKPLRWTRTAAEKLAFLDYSNNNSVNTRQPRFSYAFICMWVIFFY